MHESFAKTWRLSAAGIAFALMAGCGGGDGAAVNSSASTPSNPAPTETVPADSVTTADSSASNTTDSAVTAERYSSSATSTAYSGTAVGIPSIIQAENFDKGGEGLGYHDTTASNLGGQYRTREGVDIIQAAGNYAVNNFRTGEWMVYSITVPTTGAYDFDLNASSTASDAAFHVEIDGQNVTGSINAPNTGSLDTFQWWGLKRLNLTAGAHRVKVVVDQEPFNLDAIRLGAATVTAPTATPYLGAAAAVPGTFEAENYDNGGEGLAFHDMAAGNSGGQYRPNEAVDIIASSDASGGFAVNNIQTGEWMAYSINVGTAGSYDLELRASSMFSNAAYHVEIDGQNVSGSIGVPSSGAWNVYQWVGKKTLALTAGRHSLKIVAEQEYFDLDSIRIAAPAASGAKLLFSSSYEGSGLNLVPPVDCWGTGCWQDFLGLDSVTSFTWPGTINGGGGKFLMLSDPVTTTSTNIGNYLFNRLDTVAGHNGSTTKALMQQISQNVNGTAPMGTSAAQNEFQFLPKTETTDLYVSYWLKLQPDMVQKMTNLPAGPGISGGGTWRAIFAFKTGGQTSWGGPADNGDYRVEAYVMTYGGGQPYWCILGDNNAGGGAPLVNNWTVENHTLPVPVGQWFKMEVYWHRSAGSDGRVWMAVNGQTIADHRGPNMGANNMPINRIMAPMLYTGSAMPVYQWVDDLEIWDGFPSGGGSNPPYAAH